NWTFLSKNLSYAFSNLEWRAGNFLELFESDFRSQLNKREAFFRVNIEYPVGGDNLVHTLSASKRQVALCEYLRGALLGHVVGHYDDGFSTVDQVHRAAHAADHLAGNHPVGKVAVLRDFHGPKDGNDNGARTDHHERRRRAEVAQARCGRNSFLAGVDQL